MKKSKALNKSELKELVTFWAIKINVTPKQVRVLDMKRKWASCSTSGWISLNTDLLEKPRQFQDYVIIHELLHMQIPNHGKLFKSMFAAFFPEWKKYEK